MLSRECARNLPFQHDADAERLQQFWLAVVKLANGSLPELRRQIEIAQRGWREVITEAEPPEALKIGLAEITKLDEKARREVEARDQAQYIAWLRDVKHVTTDLDASIEFSLRSGRLQILGADRAVTKTLCLAERACRR